MGGEKQRAKIAIKESVTSCPLDADRGQRGTILLPFTYDQPLSGQRAKL